MLDILFAEAEHEAGLRNHEVVAFVLTAAERQDICEFGRHLAKLKKLTLALDKNHHKQRSISIPPGQRTTVPFGDLTAQELELKSQVQEVKSVICRLSPCRQCYMCRDDFFKEPWTFTPVVHPVILGEGLFVNGKPKQTQDDLIFIAEGAEFE